MSSLCCDLKHHPDKAETASVIEPPSPAGISEVNTAAHKPGNAAASLSETTAEISSDPLGADIEIDGSFVGSTPSSVGVARGEHTLRISKDGYKPWVRSLRSSTGSIKIAAVLDPTPTGTAPGAATNRQESNSTAAPTSSVAAASTPPSSEQSGQPEDLIGIWFTGNSTVRHDGVEIAGVQPKGPADNIDIKAGDIILAIDGHFLVTIEELRAELLKHTIGKPLAIRYRHGRLTSENYLILGSKDAIPKR